MKLGEFIEEIMRFGLERFRRYYGPYRALVVSNKDPEAKGRVRLHCPRARLGKDNSIWVYPMDHGAAQDRGLFWPPEEGDAVWVFFDNGDPTRPLCYLGGWYGGDQTTEVNSDMRPDSQGVPRKRGLISTSGHKIILDDSNGAEQVIVEHKSGQRVLIDNTGVSVGNKNGVFERMLKAETFKELFDNHIHGTDVGPSTPPTIPLPDLVLSNDVKNS